MTRLLLLGLPLLFLAGCKTPKAPKLLATGPKIATITNRQGKPFKGQILGVEDTWLHLESRNGSQFTVSMENFRKKEQARIRKMARTLKLPPGNTQIIEGSQTFSQNDRIYHVSNRQPVTGRVMMRNSGGSKRAQLSCFNGYLHGVSTFWNKAGNRSAEIEYRKGNNHGISVYWYPNNNLQSRAHYYDGKLHGEFQKFHHDGKRKSRSYWRYGTPIEKREDWHPNGHLAHQYTYVNGQLWSHIRWNEFGDLIYMNRNLTE